MRVKQGCGRCSQQKTCNISETEQDRPRLLSMTNRKSHTRFRLMPKSTTSDDLEGPLSTLFQNTCVFRNSDTPRKFEWRYTYTISDEDVGLWHSGKGLCGYSRGFHAEGASNDSGVIENVQFQGLRTSPAPYKKWGQHYYIVLFRFLSPFHWPQNAWPWMTLKSWIAILR